VLPVADEERFMITIFLVGCRALLPPPTPADDVFLSPGSVRLDDERSWAMEATGSASSLALDEELSEYTDESRSISSLGGDLESLVLTKRISVG